MGDAPGPRAHANRLGPGRLFFTPRRLLQCRRRRDRRRHLNRRHRRLLNHADAHQRRTPPCNRTRLHGPPPHRPPPKKSAHLHRAKPSQTRHPHARRHAQFHNARQTHRHRRKGSMGRIVQLDPQRGDPQRGNTLPRRGPHRGRRALAMVRNPLQNLNPVWLRARHVAETSTTLYRRQTQCH
jgi:hypothetical protein